MITMINMSRARAYCFTSNNYTDETVAAWRKCGYKYLVLGREVGESGTPHLQGYVEFATVKSLSQLKNIDGRAHFEVRRGTPQQAAEYCKKDGNFEEDGQITRSKDEMANDSKARWEGYVTAAKENRMDDIPAEIRIRYYKSLVSIRSDSICASHMDGELDNYWIVGPSGVGKTRWAVERFPAAYFKTKDNWWDHYAGEDTVLIDDLGPKDVSASVLKNWADRYAFPAGFKGGSFRRIRPKRIIVTSNYTLEQLYNGEDHAPLRRRFKVVNLNDLGGLDPMGFLPDVKSEK